MQKTSTGITILSTVLVLVILAMYGILALHTQNLTDLLKQNLNILVEVSDSLSNESIVQLEDQIRSLEHIEKGSVLFIPKEDAVAFMQAELESGLDLTFKENPFSNIIQFNMAPEYVDESYIKSAISEIKTFNGVEDAIYYGAIYTYFNKNIQKVGLVLLVLGLLLACFAYSLMYSTIYLALYSDRFKIRTMELVGATPRQVRLPFFIKGTKIATVSCFIAIVSISVLLGLLVWQVELVREIINIWYVLIVYMLVILFGLTITLMATFLVLQKYLGKSKQELFTK